MKILVIGGAGYIGSHVVKELLANEHEVTVFDNFSSGLEENLFAEANLFRGDILNKKELDEAFSGGFEAVIHLAAFKAAGESMLNPSIYAENNISGTINILNAMLAHEVRYFLFSSSAAVYGSPQYLPMDEEHPLEPENFYGFTKLEIERILHWYAQLKGMRFGALRYFNAAGYDVRGEIKGLEKNPANLLPVIMEAATGMRERLTIFGNDYDTPDGTGIRDYIHVSDLAIAHVKTLDYMVKEDKSLTVNLATGKGYSVLEVYNKAREITGLEIPMRIGPRRPGDPAKLYAVSARAKKLLDFEAKYSDLDTLLKTMWEAYNR